MKKIVITLFLVLFTSSVYAGSCPMMAKNIDSKIEEISRIASNLSSNSKILNQTRTQIESFLRTSSSGSQPVLWDKISWNEYCIEHGIADFQI